MTDFNKIVQCPHCKKVVKDWSFKNICPHCGKVFFCIMTQYDGLAVRKKFKVGKIKKWWWSQRPLTRRFYRDIGLFLLTAIVTVILITVIKAVF